MSQRRINAAASALLAAALLASVSNGQDEPLVAGSEGVPLPKKTRHVQPAYPTEAREQGIRGIVILELVVDTEGKVTAVSVIRSVPGLDEAAIAAARQWQYAVTKIDGRAVSVKVTVPITFTLKLPEIAREPGIPELRQGAVPPSPPGASGRAVVRAEITLDPDGRVGLGRIVDGEMPWSGAVLQALRTWRFAPPPEDETVSFRLEAEFLPSERAGEQRVRLRLSDLRRSAVALPPSDRPDAASAPSEAESPAPAVGTPEPAPAESAPAAEPAAPAVALPQGEAPRDAPAPTAAEAPSPDAGPPASEPQTAGEAQEPPGAGPVPGALAPPPETEILPAPPPPPTEVITAPAPALPPENGVSAIRGVTLEPGVPDLARGRQPAAPPFARLARASGTVEVAFSVGAAGTTAVKTVAGSELHKAAAETTVASWFFRRSRADRIDLVAVFTYDGDRATAVVRPQPEL